MKTTPAVSGWLTRRGADASVAGHEMQGPGRHAGLVQQAHGLGGDEGRLLGWLGDDAVAGHQGRRHLAEEDGEREVPRRDGDEDAASAQAQQVQLPGRAGQALPVAEQLAPLRRVIAAEVDRLAQLGDGVVEGLAALGLQEVDEPTAPGLDEVGGALERGGAARGRRLAPGAKARARCRHRAVRRLGGGFGHVADNRGAVDRAEHRPLRMRDNAAVDHRRGMDRRHPEHLHLGDECVEGRLMAELDAVRVAALGAVEVAGTRDAGVPRRIGRADDVGGTLEQALDRHVGIGRHRHEGRIGAVLEQPPHEIGEKVAMAADGGVGAAGGARHVLDEPLVEGFSHAVQALEFIAVRVAGALDDRGDGEGVVGGELREDALAHAQQPLGRCQVLQVGHRLAGEDRIIVEAAFLGALDLGVPVGPLDEAHHHAPVEPLGQRGDVVDDRAGPLLVGLDGETEAVPAVEGRIRERRGDDRERQLEPIRLLGIDREVEVVGTGPAGEIDDPRHELAQNPLAADRLVTRMQGGQLHRDAGPVRQGLVAGRAADGLDGGRVARKVMLGVIGRARALAEHVEGIPVEAPLGRARPVQRLVDGLAEHEMVAENAHGLPRRRPDRRQAEALGELAEDAFGRLARMDDARRDAEGPGGGVDQKGVRLGLVVGEVALTELVLDEPVGGGGVRHAQQRLGQDHEGEALLGGQGVFAQHLLDAAEAAALGADRRDQGAGARVDPALALRREARVARRRSAISRSSSA